MRKIISILVALGLVLAISAIATPAAALTQPQVSVTNTNCACDTGVYNITFNTTASLTEGVHSVCVQFPAGTTVPTSFGAGEVIFSGTAVFPSEITVTGQVVCFIVPIDFAAGPQYVTFTKGADIGNPCTPGSYTLSVWTDRAPDGTPVVSAAYTIAPAYSTYGFVVDFSDTYPGIAEGFIPPFKACGQNSSGADFITTYNSSIPGWLSGFNLTFLSTVSGCDEPCNNVSIWFEVTACPEGEVITLSFNGTWYTMDDTDVTTTVGEYDVATDFVVDPALVLTTPQLENYYGQLHFSSVGVYEICFYAECPAIGGCDPEASDIIASICLEFEAHQWKDAAKIELYEKWNLISLPLVPFDTDIDAILAPLNPEATDGDTVDELLSIWHYDNCAGDWLVHGNGQTSLTDIEDGKGYWFRFTYPNVANFPYTLWVWGTEKPMPELGPAEYPVCLGWNMIGFVHLTSLNMDNVPAGGYLWNWDTAMDPVVYGWTQGPWMTQGWSLKSFTADNMVPGQGYWVAFPADGAIYVP